MNPILIKLRNQLDSAPVAVRVAAFVFLFIIIYLFWNYNFWQPNSVNKIRLNNQIQTTSAEIKNLQTQLKTLENQLRVKQARVANAAQSVSKATQENQLKLISANEMRTILENLLTNKFKLSLIDFKILPAKTIAQPSGAQLFEHDMVIKFQGGYFTTLKYLQAIEDLKWKIFWDQLEYKVIRYPTAEITLRIHSLSDKEEWINA